MPKPRVEWDPSWDDDWQSAYSRLQEMIEEEKPENPEEAVEYYRYGFTAARRKPLPVWSDVESALYEDYMSGAPEPGQPQSEETEDNALGWEQTETWARRGWEASKYGI